MQGSESSILDLQGECAKLISLKNVLVVVLIGNSCLERYYGLNRISYSCLAE